MGNYWTLKTLYFHSIWPLPHNKTYYYEVPSKFSKNMHFEQYNLTSYFTFEMLNNVQIVLNII